MTSRGCPFHCSFCINSILNDPTFLKEIHGDVLEERTKASQRFRSPENVIEEILFLKDHYGITDFHFADEEFITNKTRVFDLCKSFRPLGISWSTSGRADWATEEKLGAMRESGCRYVLLGVETGSQEMMDIMHKSAKKENVISGIKNAQRSGMSFIANFMVGHPGESEKTFGETIEFCRENELVFLPTYTTLFPNSKMFHEYASSIDDWSKYFDELAKVDYTRRPFINLTEMSERELISHRNRAVALTLAYAFVGKKRHNFAHMLAVFIKLGLISMDYAPGWFQWFVRQTLRKIINIQARRKSTIQIPPNDLGQGVLTKPGEEEDGFVSSLAMLSEENKSDDSAHL
jgi:anaerobic magnesium-protoporphyrin IX monomethyl ester cyclase